MTGTDRVAEVAQQIDAEYYINVQGDEPVFNPEDIITILSSLETYRGEMLMAIAHWTVKRTQERIHSQGVFRPDGRLMYMSRSAIPGNKGKEFCFWVSPSMCLCISS